MPLTPLSYSIVYYIIQRVLSSCGWFFLACAILSFRARFRCDIVSCAPGSFRSFVDVRLLLSRAWCSRLLVFRPTAFMIPKSSIACTLYRVGLVTVCMYVYMYVCVCMYVCMYVCMCVYVSRWLHFQGSKHVRTCMIASSPYSRDPEVQNRKRWSWCLSRFTFKHRGDDRYDNVKVCHFSLVHGSISRQIENETANSGWAEPRAANRDCCMYVNSWNADPPFWNNH